MLCKITTVIVDDHDFFRETLKRYLEGIEDIEVVGEAKNGREAVEIAKNCHLVCLMDVELK